MIIECVISSPQFKDGRVNHYHTQKGFYNDLTHVFTPKESGNGNHVVHLHNESNFIKAVKEFHDIIEEESAWFE